ncbi:MAG: 23S rRNA (pseudouridine(1915)-N(3))-methyltransferase RlmH [Mycoplasmataceae bacterium]|nr:23S rRNA (pseudouridine(1915)-N(3))-methyltransferase RlmH [Mycoplasmataceae bacterium]
MIKIIAIGKKTDYDLHINKYLNRLNKNFETKLDLIQYSSKANNEARNIESAEIIKKIKPSDFVILLDERGKELNNTELCNKITNNRNVIFIIGGPYGVNDELRKRANFVWSISSLIVPYEFARLLLVEQIYRSQEIFLNHPYHHI